jgi:hypothetical protein
VRQATFEDYTADFIGHIPDKNLRTALADSFAESEGSLKQIERCFQLLPTCRWPQALLSQFFHSWKASHLKMLAIYGLSCRLQRLALSTEGPAQHQLLIAAALNAETSHEDLGLDYNGETHAELYDDFARAFLGTAWGRSEETVLPEALEFKRWIYQNMVVKDVRLGLLTNIFSEIYNHGEYSLALPAFSSYIDRYCHFSPEERKAALLYVNVHVEGETEVSHFLVVVRALDCYNKVQGGDTDYEQAKNLFKEYLGRLGTVMGALAGLMKEQGNGAQRSDRRYAG